MKLKKIILWSLIAIVTIGAVTGLTTYKNKREKDIRMYMTEISLNKFNRLSKDNKPKNTFVYIGNSSCSDCSLFDPELIKLIKNNEIDEKIYYLDINELHKNKSKWKEFKRVNHIFGTPSFIYFGKNTQTLSHQDTSAPRISELKNWIRNCKSHT